MASTSYSSVSVSGYNANPPEDDGTQASSNEVSWSKHKTKLGDPLKTAVESINTNVDAAFETVEGFTPSGVVFPYAGSAAPSGFLLCDGSAVSRTTYAALFTVVGTTYGIGDGATTFNLPDITGRVIAGKESSATRLTSGVGGVDGATLGATGGSQSHTLTTTEMPAHSHSVTDGGHTHDVKYDTSNTQTGTGVNRVNDISSSAGSTGTDAAASATTGITIDSAGGDGAHANVQPTIVLNYIIKT